MRHSLFALKLTSTSSSQVLRARQRTAEIVDGDRARILEAKADIDNGIR